MQRLAIAALGLAACGTTVDERPANLDYITEAILVPNCGTATCHSSFTQEDGFVFDTVEAARATFQRDPELIGFQADDPTKTPGLFLNLTIEQAGAPRMPYTAPIPDVDVELIERWLRAGAPGVCNTGSLGCFGDFLIPCVDVSVRIDPMDPMSKSVTEKGAYDTRQIPLVGTPTGPRNCAIEGKVCRNGDCQ